VGVIQPTALSAEDKDHARVAAKAFETVYGAKFRRPPQRSLMTWTSCLTDTVRVLGPDHPDTLAWRNNLEKTRREARRS
jgi:hypothetical protein